MSIKELMMQIASKEEDDEFTELENSFFIFFGNMIITGFFIIVSFFTRAGIIKTILLLIAGLSLITLTGNAFKLKKMLSEEK